MRHLSSLLGGRDAGDTSGPGTPEAASWLAAAERGVESVDRDRVDVNNADAAADDCSDADDASHASSADSYPAGGDVSASSSVFVLCNSAVGAGVLAMPLAYSRLGLLGGLTACAALGTAQGFTLYVLVKLAERFRAPSYASLLRRALGPRAGDALSAIIALYLTASCSAYCVIVADCFVPLLESAGASKVVASRPAVICATSAFVLFPLCLPRRLGALARVSAGAVAGFAFCVVAVVTRSIATIAARPQAARWDGVMKGARFDYTAFTALPLIVFALNCHPNIVSVFHELVEHPDLFGVVPGSLLAGRGRRRHIVRASSDGAPTTPRHPRSPRLLGMIAVIAAAFGIVLAGYIAVGVCGYAAHPTTVGGNILNSFPDSDRVIQAARAVVGAVVVAHYPLNQFPARHAADDFGHHVLGLPRMNQVASAAFASFFVVATSAVALVVTDLSTILAAVGGTAAPTIIFFLPGLLLLDAAIHKTERRRRRRRGEGSEGGDALLAVAHPSDRPGLAGTGLIYSPRKSWWAGVACITLAVALWGVTLASIVAPPQGGGKPV